MKILCPIEWIRMTNDEYELYEFSLHTIHELYTNHELRITNREYAHSVVAL